MRRIETYVGQQVYEWAFSAQAQYTMTSIAKVCAALFGTGGTVNGLACTPTSPATMTVQIGAGEIYQIEPLEATTCGTLPANTTNTILKQGIQLGTFTTGTFATPGTSGQSINYLIEAQYQDSDISLDPTTGNSPVVLQFYNSTNPSTPWSGPNNSGSTSNTFRDGVIAYTIKPGVAAATGSQVTPSPDTGWIGLWVVTVPFGASTLTSANIAQYTGAPVLPNGILQSIITGNLTYGVDNGTANTYQATFPIPVTTLTDGMDVWVKIKTANTGASTFTPNPGVVSASPVVGAAHAVLQGGEFVASGRANLVWRQDITSWVLIECTGAAIQVSPATASQHAMQLGQAYSFAGTIAITGNATLTASAFGNILAPNAGSSGGFTLTLPSATGNVNKAICIFNSSSGNITLSAGNFNTSYGAGVTSIIVPPNSTVLLECDGTSYNGIGGSAAIGSMVRPQIAAGVGSITGIASANTYNLPAGGTWWWFYTAFSTSTGVAGGASINISPGGSQIF
ncbi:MAG: hypothetical protein OSB38_28755, partial [Paraburkholderia fungorum]|nr:hypothetical protein [Paraburkholderia fungorum]